MNDLIERYIYDVKRRLKENQRVEIEKELRMNIEDMLADDHSEANIKKVLLSLGSPAKLAVNYKEPQYLISPEMFDDYIRVLTIVLIVFASITVIGGVVGAFFSTETVFESILEVFFGSLIQSLFTGFGITTLIFVGMEAYQKKHKPEFKLESLPKVPKVESKKNLRVEIIVEMIFSIVFGIIFVFLLLTNYGEFTLVLNGNTHEYTGQIINQSVINIFIPLIIVSMVISNIIRIIKFKEGGYTLKLGIAYTLFELASIIIFTVIVLQPNLFENGFIEVLNQALDIDFAHTMNLTVKGIISMVWIIFLIEQVVIWYKLIKQEKKSL
ncbi:MAG: hypothetical protein CVV63_00775 [Tenericutes bacterium HGW-Tenericutes-8]|nr:MAG: hypothetical protein CVV63_00775 [Tenericutes bacterium HGW-Tenericutes-8]